MKIQAIAPTGEAQTFAINETFFSTTDLRGLITAGNEVFSRTSGYALEEMFGQPHNLIRHPGMPRVVFKLLWRTCRAGKLFMGYVKNHARNGNHYWVFAVIVPIPHGYLSVRIKPSSPLLATIETVYGRLADTEARAVEGGKSESQAADVAEAQLRLELRQLGFSSYEAFGHHALNREIKERDREVEARSLRLFPAELPQGADEALWQELRQLFTSSAAVYQELKSVFTVLDSLSDLCRQIDEHKEAIHRISDAFRLNAFNAHIAAHPLGAEGVTLGTVAAVLHGHGQTLSRDVSALAEQVTRTTTAVADVTSNLSAARIQIEMLLGFLGESAQASGDAAAQQRRRVMIEDLRAGFASTLANASRAMDLAHGELPGVLGAKEQLRKDIVFIQVAQVSGLTEVSRLRDGVGLHTTFMEVRSQVESGKRELEQLDQLVERLQQLTVGAPQRIAAIGRGLDRCGAAAPE